MWRYQFVEPLSGGSFIKAFAMKTVVIKFYDHHFNAVEEEWEGQ